MEIPPAIRRGTQGRSSASGIHSGLIPDDRRTTASRPRDPSLRGTPYPLAPAGRGPAPGIVTEPLVAVLGGAGISTDEGNPSTYPAHRLRLRLRLRR